MRPRRSEASTIWSTRYANRSIKTGYIFRTKSSGALAAISANSKGMPSALQVDPKRKAVCASSAQRPLSFSGEPLDASSRAGLLWNRIKSRPAALFEGRQMSNHVAGVRESEMPRALVRAVRPQGRASHRAPRVAFISARVAARSSSQSSRSGLSRSSRYAGTARVCVSYMLQTYCALLPNG
jgi:hypothetical protein